MHPLVSQIRQLLATEYGESVMTCSLATADYNGNPAVRTMVLRDISDEGALLFVSDRRTHKDDHLRDRPQCEVLFWLPKQNVQLRIVATATVLDAENDIGMREAWWDRLDPRGTRILSRDKAESPETIAVPVTFELINAIPLHIRIENYREKPIRVEEWKRS